jgi:membrane protein
MFCRGESASDQDPGLQSIRYCPPEHRDVGYRENELRDDAAIALPEWRLPRPRALSSEAVAMRQRRNGRVRRQMGQIRYRVVDHAVLRGAERVWRYFRFKDLYRSGKEFELTGRAMGFAALAMLTVFPLLVVVAAASAAAHHGLAVWVVYGMGLTRSSARAVVQLFSAPARVLSTTSVFSVLLLAVFGVMFAGSVQAGFEKIWGLPAGPWHKIWRQAVWLIVLIAYIYAAATVGAVTRNAPAETVSRVSVAVVLGIVFFWWGLRFLVGGRVSYLAAMPGAVVTVAFLAGLRAFSALVFEPLIASNAVTYGALGTVLIVQSWLIGVGWVVYGGQLSGRWFYDAWLRAWADSRWGRRQPGGGEEGHRPPGGEHNEPAHGDPSTPPG